MNKTGLVKIKILSIFFVLGILCFTVIPKALDYYNESKKEKYVEVAKNCIKDVKNSINSLGYKQLPKENQALLVKLSSLSFNAKSPYGTFKDEYSYVVVVNMGDYYDYYFAAIDSNYWGVPIVSEKELTKDSITYGKSKLNIINEASIVDSLYVAGTIFEESSENKDNDKNVLLSPVTDELTITYEFRADVYKIYDKLIKNIDTDIYNREATINNGVLKYKNEVISEGYLSDISGFFRYLAFPSDEGEKYYSSFVTYNNRYVAGIINESSDYSAANIIFDSLPTIVINRSANVVVDQEKKYLMWNLMAVYPDNDNYTITECGALILKNNTATEVNLAFDTSGVMVGKSNNSCELGNIFAIRKDNIKEGDCFFGRGYIKYLDRNGNEHISLSDDTVSVLVK